MGKIGKTIELKEVDQVEELLNRVEHFHDWTIKEINISYFDDLDEAHCSAKIQLIDSYKRKMIDIVEIELSDVDKIHIDGILKSDTEILGIEIEINSNGIKSIYTEDRNIFYIKANKIEFSFYNHLQ